MPHTGGKEKMTERTYTTMAGSSIGKCSSGHWLPLKGPCDLCGATDSEPCKYTDACRTALSAYEK